MRTRSASLPLPFHGALGAIGSGDLYRDTPPMRFGRRGAGPADLPSWFNGDCAEQCLRLSTGRAEAGVHSGRLI